MKRKFSFKHCISVLLVAVMVLVGFVAVKPVAAADEEVKADTCTEYASEYYDGENYAGYRASVTDEEGNVSYPNYPTKDGYVFAGWYQGTEEGTAIDLEKPLGETAANSAEGAWAKFVPDEVLSVKAQISANMISTDANADKSYADIRFVTTVDNLKYSQIGFDFAINGGNTITRASNKVYTQLRAVGETTGDVLTYSPAGTFCGLSTYFKTWTFTNVPEASFDAQFSVTPFWVTLDGTKVCGELAIKTVNQGLAYSELRPFEAEYDYEYYESLEGAIEAANDETNGKSEAVITLLDDVVIEDTIAIGGEGLTKCTNITITNFVDVSKEGDKVEYSITKSSDFAGTNMFSVASDYALTIEGADSNSKAGITVDGNSVDTGASMISNAGTFTVNNATVKNGKVTIGGIGGAITNSGTLNIDNSNFVDNQATGATAGQGGAINISGGAVTITDTIFDGNSSTKDGGAIRNGSSVPATIANCTFTANTAGIVGTTETVGQNASGGAIYMTGTAAFAEGSVNNMFTGNSAPLGGAIGYNTTATSTMADWSFSDNSSYRYISKVADSEVTYSNGYGGAIYVAKGEVQISSTDIETYKFTGNDAYNGGTIFVQAASSSSGVFAGKVKLDNVAIEDGTSSNVGGAIYIASAAPGSATITGIAGEVEIAGSTIKGNQATNQGGAIYVAATANSNGAIAGQLTIKDNTLIENNQATNSSSSKGGAIYVHATLHKDSSNATGASLTLMDVTMKGNVARDGGAVFVLANGSGEGTVNATNVIFEGNQAKGNCGGAIYNQGDFIATNCQFNNSAAVNGTSYTNAGAVYLNVANAYANITNSSFTGNQANKGGAIGITNGVIEVSGCTFVDNIARYNGTADGAGAAIWSKGSGVVKLNESGDAPNTFSGNTAGNGFGGAVAAVTGTINIGENVFEENTAVNGGAIYVGGTNAGTVTVNVSGATFKENAASTTGNDIAVDNEEAITINGSAFENGEVSLIMSGTDVGVANISGELTDVAFRYYNYDKSSTIAEGITVNSADIATTSDINIIPYTSAEGTPVVFGSDLATDFSAEEQERFNAVESGTGKSFGVDVNGQLAYVNVAYNETTSTGYPTLAEAVSGATAGDTITLLRDIEIGARLENKKNLTIQAPTDKSVSIYKGSSFTSNMLKVNGSTSLTITSNGNNTITFDGRSADNAVAGATEGTNSSAMLYVLGNLTMKDVTVQYTKCTGTGGALQLNANNDTKTAGKLDLDGCVFNSNISTTNTGGAIHIQALTGSSSLDANVTHEIKNTTFINNSSAANYGGAIYMNSYTKAEVTGCTFVGNTSSKEGGAVYLNANTNFAVDECTFVENASIGASAGAIYSKSTGAVSINNTDFESNIAYGTLSTATTKATGKGGAIWIYAAATDGFSITNCDFTGNQAGGEGGAIRHDYGDLYITDCNFTNNVASANFDGYYQANGSGGAIYVSGSANALINATAYDTYSFTGNTADRGSSVYTWGAIANNSTGTVKYSGKYAFENNTHQTYGETGIGVGIHSDDKVITQINDADSYEALAKAVSIASTTQQTEITLLGDIEMGAPRIDINSDQNIIIKNAKDVPVVIYRTANSASNMFNVNAGGSLKFMSNEEGGTLTIDGKNIAKASMLYGRGVLELEGITLQNGNSSRGGAVQLRAETAQLIVNDCTFTSNVSQSDGGAISLVKENDTCPTVEISNTTFTGNSAKTNGGAIYMEGGTLTAEAGVVNFTSNTAASGGAIYQNGGTVTLLGGGTASNNSATGSQGGAFNANGGTSLSIANYTFTGNTSKSDGGAIRGAINVNVTDCSFSENHAAYNHTAGAGGAIYMTNSKTLTLSGTGAFSGNTAYTNGNAISYNAAPVNEGTYTFGETDYIYDRNAKQNVAL